MNIYRCYIFQVNKVKTNLSTPKLCRLYINADGSQCLQTNYNSNDPSPHAEI